MNNVVSFKKKLSMQSMCLVVALCFIQSDMHAFNVDHSIIHLRLSINFVNIDIRQNKSRSLVMSLARNDLKKQTFFRKVISQFPNSIVSGFKQKVNDGKVFLKYIHSNNASL